MLATNHGALLQNLKRRKNIRKKKKKKKNLEKKYATKKQKIGNTSKMKQEEMTWVINLL